MFFFPQLGSIQEALETVGGQLATADDQLTTISSRLPAPDDLLTTKGKVIEDTDTKHRIPVGDDPIPHIKSLLLDLEIALTSLRSGQLQKLYFQLKKDYLALLDVSA